MSPPSRLKGESPSAQRDGRPIHPPSRLKGKSPSAQREGGLVTLPGSAGVLVPQRAARRVIL
jgi:hypothetical protein